MTSAATGGQGRRSIVEDVGSLIGLGYIGQGGTFVLALLTRRLLGPAEIGVLALLGLAATYAPYLALGSLQALERLVALNIGREDPKAVRRLEAGATAMASIAALVFAALMLAVIATGAVPGNTAVMLVLIAATLAIQQVTSLAIVRLRTRLRFRTVALVNLAMALIVAAGAAVGALVAGLTGALLATVLGYAAGAAIAARRSGLVRPSTAPWAIRTLARAAPAFLALGAAAVLMGTIDQLVVAGLLGPAAFGLYTTAYLGNAFLVRIPANIGAALYPRLQISVGHGTDRSTLQGYQIRATTISGLVAGPLVAVAIICVPVVVQVVLPDYGNVLTPMRLVLMAVLGLVLASPAIQLLVSIGRQWLVAAVTFASSGIILTISLLLSRSGSLDINSVALVDCLVYLAYGVTLQVALRSQAIAAARSILRVTALTYVPASVGLLVVSALDPGSTANLAAFLPAVVCGIGATAVAWVAAVAVAMRTDAVAGEDLLVVAAVATKAWRSVTRRGRGTR